MGWIVNIVVGLVGLFIGEKILGSWGFYVVGMVIVLLIIGVVILVVVVLFFFG